MATMYPTEREERQWSDADEYRRGWNAAMDAAGLTHLRMNEPASAVPAVARADEAPRAVAAHDAFTEDPS